MEGAEPAVLASEEPEFAPEEMNAVQHEYLRRTLDVDKLLNLHRPWK